MTYILAPWTHSSSIGLLVDPTSDLARSPAASVAPFPRQIQDPSRRLPAAPHLATPPIPRPITLQRLSTHILRLDRLSLASSRTVVALPWP